MHVGRSWPRETGGLDDISAIADRQIGPTCGFEAVENIIQLFLPFGNELSRDVLMAMASNAGYLVMGGDGPHLVTTGFQPLLTNFGISAQWARCDHAQLIGALHENRVAVAVVDAHYLAPSDYPFRYSWHAIIVTNFVTDPTGCWVEYYAGVDSNFPNQTRLWNVESFTHAAQASGPLSLLITHSPARFGRHNVRFERREDGKVYRRVAL